MMKIGILIISILSSILSFSQDFTLINSYKSPISKKNYTIGDTITIGQASLAINQEYTYYNIFTAINHDTWVAYHTVSKTLLNSTGIIKKIYSYSKNSREIVFRNSVVLEVELKGNEVIFIRIDKAIKSKEIIIYPSTVTLNYPQLNNKLASILNVKLQNLDKEQSMLNLMAKINKKKYNEWKENEFTYQKEKDEYLKKADSIFKLVNINDTLLVVLKVDLGKYDFSTQSFPIPKGDFYNEKYNFITQYGNTIFNFINFTNFNSLNSSLDVAEYFVTNNEISPYKETRTAYIVLKVKLEAASLEEDIVNYQKKIYTYLILNILEMHCFDNSSLNYNYIGYKY